MTMTAPICGYEVETITGRKDRYGLEAAPRFVVKGVTHKGGKPIEFRSRDTARAHILCTVERGKYAGKD